MSKPKLLYASPFPPQRSGISDYSYVLVSALAEFYDITLLVKDMKIAPPIDCEKIEYTCNGDYSGYENILYNIGNNPEFHNYMYECLLRFPGHVIMHDFVLYYLVSDYYNQKGILYSSIYKMEGADGIRIFADEVKRSWKPFLQLKRIASLLPMNSEVISSSKSILCHSDFTKKLILNVNPNAVVHRINMINMNEGHTPATATYLRETYGISDDAYIIGSFGYIAETKQNHIICEAIKRYNASNDKKLYYVMAGDGDFINAMLDKYIIKTGYVEREAYDSIMARCNLVANLRYPSMGETSISLIHAMGMGKPCLVTDDAWFSEMPDECLVKLPAHITPDELANRLNLLLNSENELKKIGYCAHRLVACEYTSISVAEAIYNATIR